jgi:hypothetical protein
MLVSIDARLWCDRKSGSCSDEDRVGATQYSGRGIEVGSVLVARCNAGGRTVFVVYDLGQPNRDSTKESVVIEGLGQRRKGVVAVITEATAGRCTMTVVSPSTPEERATAARAAAVVQASWAWDESPVIMVSVGNEVIKVAPRHDAGGWWADAETTEG